MNLRRGLFESTIIVGGIVLIALALALLKLLYDAYGPLSVIFVGLTGIWIMLTILFGVLYRDD